MWSDCSWFRFNTTQASLIIIKTFHYNNKRKHTKHTHKHRLKWTQIKFWSKYYVHSDTQQLEQRQNDTNTTGCWENLGKTVLFCVLLRYAVQYTQSHSGRWWEMHVTKTRRQQAEYQKRCNVMSRERYKVREIKGTEKKRSVLQYLTLWRLTTYTECPRRNVPNFGRVFLR